MTPREVLEKWLDAFNKADSVTISHLYADDALNHQVAHEPVVGRHAIKEMFVREFAHATMVCIPGNIFESGDWAILEWKDPKGLGGCGFFKIKDNKIIFQ